MEKLRVILEMEENMLTRRDLEGVELYWHGTRLGFCPPTLAVRRFGELAPRFYSGNLLEVLAAIRDRRALSRQGVSLSWPSEAVRLTPDDDTPFAEAEASAFADFSRRFFRQWLDESADAEIARAPWVDELEAEVERWERTR